MKKILFSILAVAAVSVSCTKFAEDPKIDFDEAAAPAVTAKTLADDQIEVTVTAQDGTSWFSYIVAAGEAEALNATNLLQGKYASAAVTYGADKTSAAAVVDFKKTTSVKLTIDGLDSNTPYTVYAVASNAQGVVSEVATATTVTTDETAPVLDDYAFLEDEDGSLLFQIVFDDPIKLSGKGSVTAHFFAVNGGADAEGNLVEQKSVEISSDALVTVDNSLIVTVPASEYIPGAIVAVTYPQGIVTNALGAECAAFDDTAITEELETDALAGLYENVSFKLSKNKDGDKADDGKEDAGAGAAEDKPEVFTDWTKLVMLSYAQNKYALADLTDDAAVKITVVDGNGRTVSYDGQQLGIIDEKTVGVALDEDPGYGVYVSYTIAAGSIVDIYGNENEEFTVTDGYYCSYGYTLDDILGTYTLTGKSPMSSLSGVTLTYPLEIVASDNAEYGNVMITNVCGVSGKLYCEADLDAGTLKIYEQDVFYGTQAAGYLTYFNGAGDKTCTFEPGMINFPGIFALAEFEGTSITGFVTDSNGYPIALINAVATRE